MVCGSRSGGNVPGLQTLLMYCLGLATVEMPPSTIRVVRPTPRATSLVIILYYVILIIAEVRLTYNTIPSSEL